MPDDESDDYHRGCERGVSATVTALTDVLERGKRGPFANPELDRFATVLEELRAKAEKSAVWYDAAIANGKRAEVAEARVRELEAHLARFSGVRSVEKKP